MQTITTKLKVLPHGELLPLPTYQTLGSAGMDLHSAENRMVGNGETVLVATGLAMEIPEGYEMQIRSRSGMASKGIFVTNSPGTIDSDYRGEIKVILTNHSGKLYQIKRGDRIAQALIAEVIRTNFKIVEDLTPTARGVGGYGSTGA
jgi:deoxyuridine 5'-triphosphate nucleotidohydrolase